VSSLGILMAYEKGEAQEKHDKSTWKKLCVGISRQTSRYVDDEEHHVYHGVWPCCALEEWKMERVDRALEGPWKDNPNLMANSLQPGEDDVDRTTYLTF
jgi:hypothetical protein